MQVHVPLEQWLIYYIQEVTHVECRKNDIYRIIIKYVTIFHKSCCNHNSENYEHSQRDPFEQKKNTMELINNHIEIELTDIVISLYASVQWP